jgi:hypothetical protein
VGEAGRLEALAMRCLDKDRDRRPVDGTAVLGTLEDPSPFVDGVAPTLALPSAPATRVAIPEAKRATAAPWVVGGMVALATATIGGWALFGRVAPSSRVESTSHVALGPPDAGVPDAFVSVDAAAAPLDVGVDAGSTIVRVRRAHPTAPPPSSLEGRVPPGMESAPGARELMEAGDRINEGDWRGCLDALRHAPETAHILSVRLSCASNAHDRPELERVCARIHERFPLSPFNQTCETLLTISH